MGQAAIVLLVGTLIGFGGVADDTGTDLEEPIQTGSVSVDAAGVHAEASVDDPTTSKSASTGSADLASAADATQGEASVEAGAVSAAVSLDAAEQRILERVHQVPPELPRLPPTSGTITVLLEPNAEEGAASPNPGGHPVLTASSAPEAPETGLGDVALQVGPAAAAAALAAVHVEPTLRGWRRVLPVAPWLPMYSRISRESVLEHETREAVYELLKRQPGLSLEAITEELDLSRSTARHHIRVLVDKEMVAHTTQGRCRIHYPVGREQEAIQRHLLSNENRARIVEAITEEPLTLSEVSDLLDESAGAVHFHLNKLCEVGVAERFENGSVQYRVAEDVLGESVKFQPVG